MTGTDFDLIATGIGVTAALVGGTFLAFSELVMDALGRLDPKSGIRGMQRINRRVFRSLFLFSAMGLVPAMTWTAVQSLFHLEGMQRLLIITGTISYIVGMLGVTIAGNVPMNERLASLAAETVEAAEYWEAYLKIWTRWNHVRTGASLLAAIAFLCVPLVG